MTSRPLDVPSLLDDLGIVYRRAGRHLEAVCPSPDHDDHSPSWHVVADGKKAGAHTCRSCGFGGGPVDLVAAVRRTTPALAREWLAERERGNRVVHRIAAPTVVVRELGRVELPPWVERRPLDEWPGSARSYLVGRRVTAEQVARHGLGYALRGTLARRVVVPVVTHGRLASWTSRSYCDETPRYITCDHPSPGALFGEPHATGDEATVCEGTWSALALERAGWPSPLALLGVAVTAEKVRTLSRFRRLLVATDPDDAGDRAAAQLARALGDRVERWRLPESPDDLDDDDLRRLAAGRPTPGEWWRRLA